MPSKGKQKIVLENGKRSKDESKKNGANNTHSRSKFGHLERYKKTKARKPGNACKYRMVRFVVSPP